jgi:DNA polymerase I-like protein with 3'-5' exonuclease and polymerase domains
MWGRVRPFPHIHSAHEHIRQEAEREAGNHFCQAGANGMMKLAMAEIRESLSLFGDKRPRLLLQVHDELIAEMEPEIVEPYVELSRAVMAQCCRPFAVPIEIGSKSSPLSWGDMSED